MIDHNPRSLHPSVIRVSQQSANQASRPSFALVINLRTAKEIDHRVPDGLVLRADKIIE